MGRLSVVGGESKSRVRYVLFVTLFFSILLFFIVEGLFDEYSSGSLCLSGSQWWLGDWLINYKGGFVRRGFLGHWAMHYGNPVMIVFLLNAFLFCVCLVLFFFLFCRQVDFGGYWLVMLSPAVFLFPVFDHSGGYRKELIGFTLLLFPLFFQYVGFGRLRVWSYCLIMALFPLVILSHEMLLVFLPVILIMNRDIACSKKAFTVFWLIVNAVVFIFVLLSSVELSQITSICDSLEGVCSKEIMNNGSISWLLYDASFGWGQVYRFIITQSALYQYIAVLILSLAAFYPLRHKLSYLYKDIYNLFLISAFCIMLACLSLVAVDWGRFIYILNVVLLVLTFSSPEVDIEQIAKGSPSFFVSATVLFLYTCTWRLPHYYGGNFKSGLWVYLEGLLSF